MGVVFLFPVGAGNDPVCLALICWAIACPNSISGSSSDSGLLETLTGVGRR